MLSNEMDFVEALTKKELLDKWSSLEDPRPTWDTYKKLVGMTSGEVDTVLNLWRRKKPTVPINS